MSALDAHQKAELERHVLEVAEDLATDYDRARVGGLTYSAADLAHGGGWSTVVTGEDEDGTPRARVRVFVDGTTEDVMIDDEGGEP